MTQKGQAASPNIDDRRDLELTGLAALLDYLEHEPALEKASLKFVRLHVRLARLELDNLLAQHRRLN